MTVPSWPSAVAFRPTKAVPFADNVLTTPPRFAEWFALMVPAMNLQEQIGVLTGMKLNAPPPVFDAMSGVAKEAIGEEAWAQVAGALP